MDVDLVVNKHIDIRYFFVKDKVDKGEVKIEHCSTKKMVADFFTKPLQGTLFIQCRNIIMNIKDAASSSMAEAAQECVGGNKTVRP
jgi:hypothetical protein